jgi:hypothetical protein
VRAGQVGREAAAYDRGTELNEGLAEYVELRATGRAVTLPAGELQAAQVRERAYKTGAAVGQLLDRILPDWRAALDASPSSVQSLDSLLMRAVRNNVAGRAPCAETIDESNFEMDSARHAIAALSAQQAHERTAFLTRSGWQLLIESAGAPLFPQGFDPLNVIRLGGTEVLHTRFVKLGNAAGTMSTFDRAALTEGVGPHPLFNGVRVVTVTGMAAPVVVSDSAGVLLVHATGVEVRLRGARADTTGQTIHVRLP